MAADPPSVCPKPDPKLNLGPPASVATWCFYGLIPNLVSQRFEIGSEGLQVSGNTANSGPFQIISMRNTILVIIHYCSSITDHC